MPSSIEQLLALQKVDAQLRTMRLELGELEKFVSEARTQFEEKRALTEASRQELAEMERRRREIEAQLADEEERTKDRRMRMQRIRNEKELAALRREIEVTKETNALLEEELLRLFEGGDTKAGELKALEEDLVLQEAKLEERRQEHEARSRSLAAELERATTEKAERMSQLDDPLRERYELIFERRGGLAVVEIRDGGCSGCQMRLPPQLITQIHRNVEVVFCPNCQRMLYSPPRPATK